MRRPVVLALVAVIVLLLGASAVLFQRYRKSTADFTDMKAREETARTSYAQAINGIAEIQDSLKAITTGDTSLRLIPQELESEQKLTEPNKREALESIALLDASIHRTKERIGQLEARLKKSGLRVAGLEKMIANLKQSVAEKQEEIAQLTGRVDSLQTTVAGLQTTVQQDQDTILAKNQTLEEKRRELGTIYYIIGSKKDLSSSGVIVAKGGVLGLGKTLQVSGSIDESRFTPLDTDEETIIRAPAAKVQVLSSQPTSSYELRLAGNQVELHILDPKEFRKVKHVVIMTT